MLNVASLGKQIGELHTPLEVGDLVLLRFKHHVETASVPSILCESVHKRMSHLTMTFFSSGHVLALYDPFGVDVPLNFDITHSLTHKRMSHQKDGIRPLF